MRKRGLCCRPASVCPSVHPSGTFVCCIQKAGDIVKLLPRHGSPILLVFFKSKRRYQMPRRTPSARVHNTQGGKNLRFSTEISRKRYEIHRPMVAIWTSIGSHRWRIDPCRFRWLWVTLKRGTRGIKFSGGSPGAVWRRTTKLSRITRVGWGVGYSLGVSYIPTATGQGFSAPEFFDSLLFMHTPFRRSTTKFGVVTHTPMGMGCF